MEAAVERRTKRLWGKASPLESTEGEATLLEFEDDGTAAVADHDDALACTKDDVAAAVAGHDDALAYEEDGGTAAAADRDDSLAYAEDDFDKEMLGVEAMLAAS